MATKNKAQVEAVLRKAFPGKQAAALANSISEGALAAQGVATAVAAVPAAAPAGGTGAAAGGWDTAGNRDLAIAAINGLRTDVIELQTQLNALINALKAG